MVIYLRHEQMKICCSSQHWIVQVSHFAQEDVAHNSRVGVEKLYLRDGSGEITNFGWTTLLEPPEALSMAKSLYCWPTNAVGGWPTILAKDQNRMVRPERFELPTFWFVARFCAPRQTKPTNKVQRNTRKVLSSVGSFCLDLSDVYGQNTDNRTTHKARKNFAIALRASTVGYFLDLTLGISILVIVATFPLFNGHPADSRTAITPRAHFELINRVNFPERSAGRVARHRLVIRARAMA
jgi:hypothetical protein